MEKQTAGESSVPSSALFQKFASIIPLLTMIEGVGIIFWLVSIPADAKNQFLLGFSLQRIALIAAALVGTIFSGAWFFLMQRQPAWLSRFLAKVESDKYQKWLKVSAVGGFFISYFLLSIPHASLPGNMPAYFIRVSPFLVWACLIFLKLCIWPMLKSERAPEIFANGRLFWIASALFLGLFLLIWGFIAISKIGVTPDDRYWNEAGVPILPHQILLAVAVTAAAGMGYLREHKRQPARIRWQFDLIASVCLWTLAALLWMSIDMPRSYFAPGPYPPNAAVYPNSDAEAHDLGAQFALIGQGINNNQYHDKPYYMFLLFLLRLAGGQDYNRVMQIQAAVLALFPVLLYFLGKVIHSRSAGLLIALLATFKEANSIASTIDIQVSHSRLMMTEFPTAFGIVLLCLILAIWLKKPAGRPLAPLLAGGVLGALILTRTNPLFLVPVVALVMLLAFGKQWKRSILPIVLFGVGILLVIGPWFFLNRTPAGQTFIQAKIQGVLSTRYDTEIESETIEKVPDSPPVQPDSSASAGTFLPMNSPVQFVPGHFFHNLVTSVLILPTTPVFNSLKTTLKTSYWSIHWNGELSTGQKVVLFINLVLLAIGAGSAWKISGLKGLVPLLMLLGYYLSNALGRTSGSRYLVPADWVIVFYFASGLAQLFLWRFGSQEGNVRYSAILSQKKQVLRGMILAGGLLIAGLAPTQLDQVISRRYAQQTSLEILQDLSQHPQFEQVGFTTADLEPFLAEQGAVILHGRALYPRYFGPGGGIPCFGPTAKIPSGLYPQLNIQVIGNGSKCVILPMVNAPNYFPDAADVTVLGCEEGNNIQAAAIFIESDTPQVYQRSPSAPLHCPLPVPACDSAGNCR